MSRRPSRAVAVVVAALVLVAVVAWWMLAPAESVVSTPGVAPVAVGPAAPVPVQVSPTIEDASIAAGTDAGEITTVEVLFEIFGNAGHAPGAGVSFHGPVVDQHARYDALHDPDADFGPVVGGGRTDVMGFTRVTLPLGRWRVKPPAEPQYVVILPTTRELALHLKSPSLVKGLVVDEKGSPVPRADVMVIRDLPTAFGDYGIPLSAGPDGRFEYSTFDQSLTLITRLKRRRGYEEARFRKHINVPSPEVRLYVGQLAQVDLDVQGASAVPVEVEYETLGVVATWVVPADNRTIEVVPGHVVFRARAVEEDHRLGGGAEADVKVDAITRVRLELGVVRPQEVHVVDAERTPLPAARVLLRNSRYTVSADTDAKGVARFAPGVGPGQRARVEVTGRCTPELSFVGCLDDALSVTASICDSGVALDAGYDDRRDR